MTSEKLTSPVLGPSHVLVTRKKFWMLLTELVARLESVRKEHGDLTVLYPFHDREEYRFLSVEYVAVVNCVSDHEGMKRAHSDDPSVECAVVFN